MNRTKSENRRAEELRVMLLGYRRMNGEETGETARAGTQLEIDDELLDLEQELYDPLRRARM